MIEHDRTGGIARAVSRVGGGRSPREWHGSGRLPEQARANNSSFIDRLGHNQSATVPGLRSELSQLTRGCSGPGRVRDRRGRGIVETIAECAAAEPPSRWAA